MKSPADCVSRATREKLSVFRGGGSIEGAQRRELLPEEASAMLEGLREQMTEIARLDNVLELDKDVTRGQVESDILGDGIKLTVHFRGSVRSGTFAGIISPQDRESSEFIVEFSPDTVILLQIVKRDDGTFGTLAALLGSGAASYLESQNLPEGAALLL